MIGALLERTPFGAEARERRLRISSSRKDVSNLIKDIYGGKPKWVEGEFYNIPFHSSISVISPTLVGLYPEFSEDHSRLINVEKERGGVSMEVLLDSGSSIKLRSARSGKGSEVNAHLSRRSGPANISEVVSMKDEVSRLKSMKEVLEIVKTLRMVTEQAVGFKAS